MKYLESKNVLESFDKIVLVVSFRDDSSESKYTLYVTLQVVID